MNMRGDFKQVATLALAIVAWGMWSPAQQAPLTKDDPIKHEHEVDERRPRHWKVENGLAISWQSRADDATKNQIEIFDERGNPLTKIQVLRTVQEATGGSIYDVSARQNQLIAVAAVFTRHAAERPADALLLFNFNGRLLSAFALPPWREIFGIELDAKSNIWTITTHSDNQNPSQIPMVVEYDTNGNILAELLTRSMFPLHAEIMRESREMGPVSIGYDSGVFWFWLPGSTELVTINTDNALPSITKTGLPQGLVVPMRIVREISGALVAEVQNYQADGTMHRAYDVWSPSAKSWSPFSPSGCSVYRLIGVYQDKLIYIRPDGKDICTSPAP